MTSPQLTSPQRWKAEGSSPKTRDRTGRSTLTLLFKPLLDILPIVARPDKKYRASKLEKKK